MVIVPSRNNGGETLPVATVQSAQMGRPVVASRIASIPEVIISEETGLLFEHEDADGLARATRYLLENPKEAIRIGQAARKHVQSRFDMGDYVNEYDKLYQKLIQEFNHH